MMPLRKLRMMVILAIKKKVRCNMKSRIFFLILCLSLFTNNSFACSDIKEKLVEKMMKSKATTSEILVSTMNRLGYGIHSASALTVDRIQKLEKKKGKKVAIELIANRLNKKIMSMKGKGYFPYRQWAQEYEEHKPYISLTGWNSYVEETIKKDESGKRMVNRSDLKRAERRVQMRRRVLESLNIKGFNPQSKILDFWSNHFHISNKRAKHFFSDYEYTLKKEICGTVDSMLKESAKHPAMLYYLDNFRNQGCKSPENSNEEDYCSKKPSKLNENYGREIIELHTLGVGPIKKYDEKGNPIYYYQVGDDFEYDEVLEATKVLSGFSFGGKGEDFGFTFNLKKHEEGNKIFPILFGGKTTIGEGLESSMGFISKLVAHRLTKDNICKKLITSIFGRPIFKKDESILNRCRMAYGDKGDLPAMYNSIILSDTFFNPEYFGMGIKSPIESIFSMLRALGILISKEELDGEKLSESIKRGAFRLGHEIYSYGPPTGQMFTTDDLNSSGFVSSRYDVFINLDARTEINRWGKKGPALEEFIDKKITKNLNSKQKSEIVNIIFQKIAPVFSKQQREALERPIIKYIDKPDYIRKKGKKVNLPIQTTVMRAIGSGVGLRK